MPSGHNGVACAVRNIAQPGVSFENLTRVVSVVREDDETATCPGRYLRELVRRGVTPHIGWLSPTTTGGA